MEFVLLTKEELEKIYNERLVYDFPKAEVKSLRSMYNMMDRKSYAPYLILENGEPIGYALFFAPEDMDSVLLDYFSVFKEFRNGGKGGYALNHIKDSFPNKVVFIESENPEFQKDPAISTRRVQFYKRNGCLDSGVKSSIFTVNYINFYIAKEECNYDFCKDEITNIYKRMVIDKEQYEENIII